MNPRVNRAEFWLLCRLVEYYVPLRTLGWPEGPPWDRPTLDEAFNCRGHGLAPHAFARCLHGTIRKGWIELWLKDQRIDKLSALGELGVRLAERGPVPLPLVKGPVARLTPMGGAVWESFARPEWDRFIEDFPVSEPDGTELREVTTRDPVLLRRYREAVISEQVIDCESTSDIAEWEFVYWKAPVRACRWTFPERTPQNPVWSPSERLRSAWCEWT